MSKVETEQKTGAVRQHARLAMGEKLTGQAMQPKGGGDKKPAGGLSGAKKK